MPEFKDSDWYDVPAATREAECKRCKAVIFFVKTKSRRTGEDVTIPIDCDVDGASEPTYRDAGRGVTHFRTCPNANDF